MARPLYIIYVPGLGDGYDSARRLMLKTWGWRRNVTARLVSMHWFDPDETFEQKQKRIYDAINEAPENSKILIVGESAGGAMALSLLKTYPNTEFRVVTICGKNRRPSDIAPSLVKRNRAFQPAVRASEMVAVSLNEIQRERVTVIYSSLDPVVNRRNTFIERAKTVVVNSPGHLTSIAWIGLCNFKLIQHAAYEP